MVTTHQPADACAGAAPDPDPGAPGALALELAAALESSCGGGASDENSDDHPDGHSDSCRLLPSAVDLYRSGAVLHAAWAWARRRRREGSRSRSSSAHATAAEEGSYQCLSRTFDAWTATLPPADLERMLREEINPAFVAAVGADGEGDDGQTTTMAVRALFGIYAHSPAARRLGLGLCMEEEEQQLGAALAASYDRLLGCRRRRSSAEEAGEAEPAEEVAEEVAEMVFAVLDHWLLGGLLRIPPDSADAAANSADDEHGAGGDDDDENGDDDDDDDEKTRRVMEVVQALTADGTNCCLGDFQQWQKRRKNNKPRTTTTTTLVQAVRDHLPDTAQRDYLVRMLESTATTSSSTATTSASPAKQRPAHEATTTRSSSTNRNAPPATTITAMDRLVAQVRDVLPDLGEGYIETALAVYAFDASRTVAALVEAEATGDPSALHPRLRAVDRTLGRRRAADASTYDAGGADDQEAREAQRERMREMGRRAEREAYQISLVERDDGNMYDDDYDDQYDGLGDDAGAAGEVGGADGGLYDVDLDAVREYNRIRREEEKEAAYWEGSRNLNRTNGRGGRGKARRASDDEGEGSNGDAEQERTYRGPDKGKGGRLIGPDGRYLPIKKGGKKGKSQQAAKKDNSGGDSKQQSGTKQQQGKASGSESGSGSTDNMSKIQKRRKDANKAKIGNHHRKERALKKAGRGM